jgi:hypothetical protein
MTRISHTFYRFGTQMLYIMMLPLSFIVFSLVYRPFDVDTFLDMGEGLYPFNITMITCIVLVVLLITRLSLYFCRHHLNLSEGWYIFWCVCEVVIIAHFVTLYMWLMLGKKMLYLEVLAESLEMIALILVFPYVIIWLSLRIVDLKKIPEQTAEQKIRFSDDRNNIKLVVLASSVLYVSAEENYVNIFYMEKDKLRKFVLRNTMKNIEQLCARNGLLRCHRSYYINKNHVSSIRKDKDNIIVAELDSSEKIHIPVSRRYYDDLSHLI